MSYLILSLFVLLSVVADVYNQKSTFALIYDSPKWLLLYAFASGYLIYSIFKTRKLTIEYPSFIKWPLLTYVLGIFWAYFFAPDGNYESVFLEHFLFLTVAFAFYSILKEDKLFFKKLSIVTFASLLLMCVAVLSSRIIHGERLLPFFGSPTMYGEYMGALLVLASYFTFYSDSPKQIFRLKIALLLLSGVVLVVIQTRAPLLAYIAALAVLVSRKYSLIKFKAIIYSLLALLGLILLVFVSLNEDKIQSANIRKVRWVNTLEMIKDNPLGVGLGNYAAAYGSYQNKIFFDVEADEHSIIANPHNAFLELASESGIVVFLAFLALLFLSGRALLAKKSSYATLCFALLIYWVIDSFFNFPQDCPASYFFFAFTAGLLVFVCRDSRVQGSPSSSFFVRAIPLFIIVFFSSRILLSELITFHNLNNEEKLSYACKIDPQNWRACLRSVSLLWARGDRGGALDKLEALELRFPGHYLIRKKSIQLLFESGNLERGCLELRKFDKSFNDASSMHKILLEKCS